MIFAGDSQGTRSVGGNAAARPLVLDLTLYGLSAVFAAVTAVASTLLPHRAWGAVAAPGYLIAALIVVGQLYAHRRSVAQPESCAARLIGALPRAALTALTWISTTIVPIVLQSVQRAGGHTDRAQEEVIVIEEGGARLLAHGSPYLGREAIAALPPAEQLLGYLPYQPGMALFGLPRAVAHVWWTDARIWFTLATAVALLLAVRVLRRPARGNTSRDAALVRALQLAIVLPFCALALATGGDDLPILALCLLALALCAVHRDGAAGLAVGLAAAFKLFAWPIALVLAIHVGTRIGRVPLRFASGALGLPVAALLPPLLVDADALVENVLRFPLGDGVISSPAQSPFPGQFIASTLPTGRMIAAALLVAAGLAIALLLAHHPPRTTPQAALICGYGLLVGILLMPTTRFGYLLYPVALIAWAPVVRTDHARSVSADLEYHGTSGVKPPLGHAAITATAGQGPRSGVHLKHELGLPGPQGGRRSPR